MDIRKLLILGGLALVVAGILWPWLTRFGLGNLPGDISIHRRNFSFYFPLATCFIVSAALTLLFWLLRK